jgi:hypothetical protein
VNTALDTQHSETRSEATQVTAQIEQLSKLIQETSKVIANLSGKTKAD